MSDPADVLYSEIIRQASYPDMCGCLLLKNAVGDVVINEKCKEHANG